MNIENTIPFCNRPAAEVLDKLNRIDIASILGAVGVRFERNDAAAEFAGCWYESSENCWCCQYGVRWENGRESVVLVTVRRWGFVTVALEAFDVRGSAPFAYAAEVGSEFAVGAETVGGFAKKIRSAIAA